ncbi:AgrD family cyclic lactone autoinducer peptide [Vallitalea guaymasensis]|nr:cyclic lactone autoinducer peptide [Vallitalea guaymasensis]
MKKKFKSNCFLYSFVNFFMLISFFSINRASWFLFGEVPCPKCLQK